MWRRSPAKFASSRMKQLPWEKLAGAPLRTILQGIPELRVCKDASCNGSCHAFHPAIEETAEQLFLDVGARGFYKLRGGRSPPASAEIFQTYVRVPESALLHMFRIGAPGFYVEPRDASGVQLPHPSGPWCGSQTTQPHKPSMHARPSPRPLLSLV